MYIVIPRSMYAPWPTLPIRRRQSEDLRRSVGSVRTEHELDMRDVIEAYVDSSLENLLDIFYRSHRHQRG